MGLFHLIDEDELHLFLSYLIQWEIGWCNLMEFVFRKNLVFVLSFILICKLQGKLYVIVFFNIVSII